jgi:hypothetical protein
MRFVARCWNQQEGQHRLRWLMLGHDLWVASYAQETPSRKDMHTRVRVASKFPVSEGWLWFRQTERAILVRCTQRRWRCPFTIHRMRSPCVLLTCTSSCLRYPAFSSARHCNQQHEILNAKRAGRSWPPSSQGGHIAHPATKQFSWQNEQIVDR